MQKKMTIKELCEKMWVFEKELNLLDQQIQGIYFWELVRFKLFRELSKQLRGLGQAHTEKKDFKDKINAVGSLFINSIIRNPLRGKYTLDFLIYDHRRKINVDGNNIDIYTDDFIQSQRDKKFDIIETPYLWRHITSNKTKNRKYTDAEILNNYFMKKVSPLKLNYKEKQLIEEIQKEIKKRFNNIEIDLYNFLINELSSFMHKVDYHKRIFKKRKPKKVYIVVSYSKFSVIAAAKELGIKVIEFQHGVITDFHYAYNFGEPTKRLKYFPDKLLTFGKYWAKTKGFPKQTEVEVYGFPYLENQLGKYRDYPKKKNQILFISQGTIGKELSLKANQLAEAMPDYNFIYKLHPGEYGRWRTDYPDLIEASKLSNLEVIDSNEKNLYLLFAESEYQIGVNSTALFEGLTLDCKTIIYNLSGFEYMEDLIEQGIVEVVKNTEEATHSIKNYKQEVFPKDYFFNKI